jgi:hypothetical protein
MHRTKNDRPLVELCHRLRIGTAHVAAAVPETPEDPRRRLQLQIAGVRKPVTLMLVWTFQHIGRRWWWECPSCARRCAVLLREPRTQQPACRQCLRAVYFRDNPWMGPYVAWAQLNGWVPGPFDHWQQIAFLVNPRRRGVRRGRRLVQRAERLLACAPSLKEVVNPDVARFAKWFVDEAQIEASVEVGRQRRRRRVRTGGAERSAAPAASTKVDSFPGQRR